jgi:hypothetical protein
MSTETMKVDVLDAMDMYVAKAKDIAAENPDSTGLQQDVIQAEAARAAMAELIEVMQEAQRITRLALAERAIKGPLRSHFTGLSHRLTASLARVGGAK